MPKQSTINQSKYDAANCKQYHLKLVKNTDSDIIDKLSSVPSMQGYIKRLIREDMAYSGPCAVRTKLNEAAFSVLEGEAERTGLSVPDLVSTIVNEAVMRLMIAKGE